MFALFFVAAKDDKKAIIERAPASNYPSTTPTNTDYMSTQSTYTIDISIATEPRSEVTTTTIITTQGKFELSEEFKSFLNSYVCYV